MFYKVAHKVGSLVQVILFDLISEEVKNIIVDDQEAQFQGQGLCSSLPLEELNQFANMPIDKQARKKYLRFKGIVSTGDVVKVVKGRKYTRGTLIAVKEIYLFDTGYGQHIPYISGTNNEKISQYNVELV
jgi:hypothetical protein